MTDIAPPPPPPTQPPPPRFADRTGPAGLPPRPTPPPSTPPERPNMSRPWLYAAIAALAFAIGTVGTPLRSVGWAMALAVLFTCAIVASARRPATVAIGLAGVAFVPWLGIRMSPWLTAVNILAAVGLVLAALALPVAASLRVPGRHHVMRVVRACIGIPRGPAHLVSAGRVHAQGTDLAAHITRWGPSAAIGVVSLAIGLGVLASGDALFASFFDVGNGPEVLGARVLAASFGLVGFSLLLGAIALPSSSEHVAAPRTPGARPTLAAMTGLAVAIGLYAATQASAAILGREFVESRTGLTYAEWARSGFFQLVAVSAAATAAVLVARAVVRQAPSDARRFQVAAAALTCGVLVTVVASVVKLVVYADTFGLTMLRIYTVVFACWLGLVSVMALVSLLRPADDWLAPTVIATIVIGAFAMNVANPERIVADHNITRATTTGRLDVDYLNTLSLDAAPTILARLDDVGSATFTPTRDRYESTAQPIEAAPALAAHWCARFERGDLDDSGADRHDGLSYNMARRSAAESVRSTCP